MSDLTAHPWSFPPSSNSGASGTFVSSQLNLQYYNLNQLLKLQLFNGSPTTIGITQYYDNTLTLNNDLRFQAQLLVTQLLPLTPIMLGLPWLQDINSNIDWKNLIMQFPGPKASLAATIPLHLQSISDSDIPDPNTDTPGATQSSSTLDGNQKSEDKALLPWSPLSKLQWLPPNIPQNQYKGLWYPDQQCPTSLNNPTTTPDSATTTLSPTPVNSRNLNIKIIGTIPFACILHDGTSTFQLQIMPALPEEYLHAEATLSKHTTEEQHLI
ncbi:hypothetical protein C0989_006693 [Termitomyces sp. Mn162]|nr:hypothetical protein C0989_006693 [Termitomyces sp. Mn162]